MIRKDKLLEDMKQFLYNYCTTGLLYPDYHNYNRQQEKEQECITRFEQKQISTPEIDIHKKSIRNQQEYKKLNELKMLKIVKVLKDMI